MSTAQGTIKHNNWDEKPYSETGKQKGTIAHIDIELTGDLTGAAKTVYALAYTDGGKSAHYAGHLLFDGTLGGKQGGFIIFESGTYGSDVAKSTWQIVEGSGTGDLAGISGSGSYAATHDKTVHYTVDYQLA